MNCAKNDAEIANAVSCAPVKDGLRNSAGGSIGARLRNCTATNAASERTATASRVEISVLDQPLSFPRSRAVTIASSPLMSSVWPAQSIGRLCCSRPSWMRRTTASAARPIGTLRKKMARQSSQLVSTPPTSGPTANEAPIVAPYAANALPREAGSGKASRMSANDVANMMAAPTPCAARNASRVAIDGAAPHAADMAVKRTRPMANVRRRPRRSASEPAVSTVAARATVYASRIHWMLWKPACRSRAMLGTAVFTTAMSSMSIAVAAQTTVRVRRWRAFMSGLLSGPQHVAVAEDAVWVEAVLELLQTGRVLGPVRRGDRSGSVIRHAEEVHEPAGGVPWPQRVDDTRARRRDHLGQPRGCRAED